MKLTMMEKLVMAVGTLLVVGLLVLAALTGGLLFRDMPPPSPKFDCDDAVKFAYDRLIGWGFIPDIMTGSVQKTEYSYFESDHVWLLVPVGPLKVALDWGQVRFGKQYCQGYLESYERLLFYVEQDFAKEGKSLPANQTPE